MSEHARPGRMPGRFRWSFAGALVLIAALTAACGGGSAVAPGRQQAGSLTSGTAQLAIPNRTASSSASRSAQFISASAVSVGIAIDGASPIFASVAASSSACTATSTGRTCAIPVSAPAGNATFAFTLYDAANGGGNALGSGSATQVVVSGTPFTLGVVVNGMVASVVLSVSPSSLTMGTVGTATISATAKDADGNTIIGPGNYALPIALTNSDTSGATSIGPTSLTAPGQTATLSYTGAAVASSTTVGAQVSGLAAGAIAPTVVAFGPASTPTPSPTPLPTPTPTPTPTYGAVILSPATLSFNFPGDVRTVTATQSGNTGNSFTFTGITCPNSGSGTISQPSAGTFTVTASTTSSGATCSTTITGLGGISAALTMTF